MDMKITPGALNGTINAVASKSDAHRLLICAAVSDRQTFVHIKERSADIDATARALEALGAKITYENGGFSVIPVKAAAADPCLECAESGSTLRFLLPLAAGISGGAFFSGGGRLPERPIGELAYAMEKNGVLFSSDRLPLKITGRLHAGEYSLPGNVSSQYISGLLMTLPLLRGDSRIVLTSKLESAAYVDMTLSCLERFGITINKTREGYVVPGGQRFISPGELSAEADWSNAAFFLAAGALGGNVTVHGIDSLSPQGDKEIVGILDSFGAQVLVSGDSVTVSRGTLTGCDIDLSGIPDLLPILAVVAAYAEGETRFLNASRLRIKESDRLACAAEMLRNLGGEARELPDGLVVRGKPLAGGITQSFGDHRMAMAASIAALFCSDSTVIKNAQAVNKSYPSFYEDIRKLGAKAEVV